VESDDGMSESSLRGKLLYCCRVMVLHVNYRLEFSGAVLR